ncbi:MULTISPECIES: ABC transporter ATP-binding protein [unclassified Chelatococcus]|uniref:ABC transporter ATP-binding protein n=1 Tax=unclassified Chelatococcus TaxID=2638111 RepID=UPI001BD15DD4|nr:MULTISPECIES: ABC transporter ATP-binding protein [unclassified Chelatococcus]CAH1651867.1 Amino acid/amide ABC transporter ATP-binding protein 1 (HAAT family) [Hyphomicrobiales bacterium]MBS7743109.1 ABC transporter ATP-binding protein [Chelatococcus sp. HY11]MBX3541773.1 ABC transporter ATP-binding protein [Chelatococcus sp.]MCO5074335.1 ABC transporter ATP-binding protein [Chelatococcus sp.]CAH1693525.1 Amino acid/amide ABC transporter ATP-binding protein 1 (HAAT family) [Hyphomicrobiale
MSLLKVRQLSKRFGGLTVTRDVSITLEKGDRVALIGPNGAGKTTFVNLVTGHVRPDAGSVLLDGEDVTRWSPTRRVKGGLVRSFQVTRLFSEMTPEEHVALALLQRLGRSGRLFTDFRTMPDVVREAEEILVLFNLNGIARVPVGAIAYGQQRLLEVALVMALRPKVLLLDEPAAGVPSADIVLIERALAQLPADLAVLMIDHDMDFVFRFARKVIVMAAGGVIFDGTPEAVASDAAVRQAYLGSYADDRSVA